jgi:hypothetical protein
MTAKSKNILWTLGLLSLMTPVVEKPWARHPLAPGQASKLLRV